MPERHRGELPHLSTFLIVTEVGSFTKAARRLGISQPAVSQRIAALEKELGTFLFHRHAGRLVVSAAGKRLLDVARRILALHQEARAGADGAHLNIAGDLIIAASSVPGECYLPELLSGFRECFPDIQVRATIGDSASVTKNIADGDATIGLVGQRAERSSLASEPIGTDSLVLIVGPRHRLADRKSISLNALASESLIIREPGSATRCALENGLVRAGSSLETMRVALEMGSNAAIKDAVKRGLGASFVSAAAVARELNAGELRSIHVRGLALTRTLYAIYLKRIALAPTAFAFLTFLKSHPMRRDRG